MPISRRSPRTTGTEYSAGGIVFRKNSQGIEIAFLLDPFRKWTFAKGHIEQGESLVGAGVREVKEEMGITRVRVLAPLGKIDWWFQERRADARSPKGAMVHKFAYYFLMQVPSGTQLHPQKSERISAVRWVPLDRALKFSSYEDVRLVLAKAIAMLQR